MSVETDTDQWQWSPDVAQVLRELLPSTYDEILRLVGQEIPAYADPLGAASGEFALLVSAGIEQTLNRFIERVEQPGLPDDPRWRAAIADLGRSAARERRPLDVLLAAFRVGARHAWRRIAPAATAAGVGATEIHRLAEELFLYIDELSSLAVEGYGAEQAERAGERQRVRRALAELIVGPEPPAAATLADAAREAHWLVPDAVAVLAARDEDPDRLTGRIGGDAIGTGRDGIATIVIPDPDAPGRGLALRSACADLAAAALGQTVPISAAVRSAARAERALALIDDGILPGDGLLICSEHLLELLVHRDEALLADIRTATLRQLQELPASTRGKLLETLRAFLDHEGRMDPTAHALGVHPQTVRYRVAQLRELLGGALEDPERRLLLSIALRSAE